MDNGKKKMKKKSKLAVDILMTLTLLFLMGYQLWGETAHEWAGAFMLVLFLAHHVLNTAWHRNLFRGKYTRVRILTSAVDLALFVVMICLMVSGITMSRHVFAFLPKYHPGAADGFSGSWRRNRRIWPVCLCDKRSGDLHVSEDRVCFSELQ